MKEGAEMQNDWSLSTAERQHNRIARNQSAQDKFYASSVPQVWESTYDNSNETERNES